MWAAQLAQRVASFTGSGWRVESHTDFQVVLVKGRRPNHLLHLILTVLTLGLWAFVWLALVLFGGEQRTVLTADASGQVRGA